MFAEPSANVDLELLIGKLDDLHDWVSIIVDCCQEGEFDLKRACLKYSNLNNRIVRKLRKNRVNWKYVDMLFGELATVF